MVISTKTVCDFGMEKHIFHGKKRHLLTASKCVSFEAMLGSYHDL